MHIWTPLLDLLRRYAPAALSVIPSVFDQMWPPPPEFSIDDMPDLDGHVVLVTGGASGIGREMVQALLEHNAKVYLAARRGKESEDALRELRLLTGKGAVFLELDLADLGAIERCADEFLRKEQYLHVLLNNAGVMGTPIDQLTVQGYDLQFGTNCLGHFYLTKLLLPALTAAAQSTPGGTARVVSMSSTVHLFAALNYATLADGPARRRLSPAGQLYSQSKYGIVVFARELARRYGEQGIVSIAVNPGHFRSGLDRHVNFLHRHLVNLIFMWPTRLGALTPLWAGTARETAHYNGKYLIPWARLGAARADALDPEVGARLWAWLEAQVAGR